jgi:hypothetical protein
VISLARLMLLVVAVVVGGCSGPTVFPPSAFYSAVDLKAVVEQCAPQGVKWAARGGGSRGGGSPSSYHRYNSFYLQGEQESLDTFLQALKVELQKAVEANGGRVASSVTLSKDELPKAIARRGVKQGRDGNATDLSGFQINYEVGTTPGEILVTVTRDQVDATNPYPLNLSVDIFESGPAGQRPIAQPKPGSDR